MTTTTGPVALTAGQALTLRPPGNAQQYGAVVLQNLSPYLCVIGAGPGSYMLAPYTADMFTLPAGGQGISVNPQTLDAVIAGISANIAAVWYEPDADIDGTYPCALSSPAAVAAETANALLTQGVPATLFAVTIVDNLALDPLGSAGYTAPVSTYASLTLRDESAGTTSAVTVFVTFTDDSFDTSILRQILWAKPATSAPARLAPLSIPILGQYVNIYESTATGRIVKLQGTNRIYQRFQTEGPADDGWFQSTGLINPMVAGTTYPLSQTLGSGDGAGRDTLVHFHAASANMLVQGYFAITTAVLPGLPIIMHTDDMHPVNLGSSGQEYALQSSLRIPMPMNGYSFSFTCTNGDTSAQAFMTGLPL